MGRHHSVSFTQKQVSVTDICPSDPWRDCDSDVAITPLSSVRTSITDRYNRHSWQTVVAETGTECRDRLEVAGGAEDLPVAETEASRQE